MARLENHEISSSDHSPLWLKLGMQNMGQSKRRFRFENAWARDPMCKKIIKDSWESHSTEPLCRKIKCCSNALTEWGRDITGNFKGRISECNKIMKCLKSRRDEESVTRYKAAQTKLYEVLAQKEIFWRQRSKEIWLQAGDQNTKYFHTCASKRTRHNQICSLKDEGG